MLTSCPRCQHTFRSPCCGPCSPDPSPSLPLSFILPAAASTTTTTNPHNSTPSTVGGGAAVAVINPKPYPSLLLNPSDLDLQRISATIKRLKASGWYHEGITWQESMSLLASTKPGTFLVRDSSDVRYLFSLSVQVDKGPTSIRIHYVNGYFRLDAVPALVPSVPLFDCVVRLVEYYALTSSTDGGGSRRYGGGGGGHRDQVLVDPTGVQYSSILLTKPLYQRARPPSLQHLARLRVNSLLKHGDTVPSLDIPVTLKEYLCEYPYTR